MVQHPCMFAVEEGLMERIIKTLIYRLWPDFDMQPAADRARLYMNISGVLFSLPWLVVGLVWLVIQIDPIVLRSNWAFMLFLLGFSLVIERLPFYYFIKMGGEHYGSNSSDLCDIVLVSGYFIFGPTAVAIFLVKTLLAYILSWFGATSTIHRWIWLRNFLFNLGTPLVAILAGLAVYGAAGGQYPLTGLKANQLLAAFLALVVYWMVIALLMLLWWFLLYRSRLLETTADGELNSNSQSTLDQVVLYRKSFIFLIAAYIPGVFGILAAVLYTRIGIWIYLFFFLGVFFVSLLARRMSFAMMTSQQKTRELDQLEQLGREIIAAPADASNLPNLLEQCLPGMLSYQQLSVRLFDGHSLLNLPQDRPVFDEQLWSYIQENPTPMESRPGEIPPWSQAMITDRIVIMPILSTSEQEPIGGICLVQEKYIFSEIYFDMKPVLQVLAAQIASALHATEIFAETLEHQKTIQEMAFAGKIQSSFLPQDIPDYKGWKLSASLIPASETSGDFYDLIQLPGDCLGIVVADVTDKGMGAALFMALSRTLIRTYAIEYPDEPARVMTAANQRILMDATAGLFVTAFYGVLNTTTGELIYSNAGHNPPFSLHPSSGAPVDKLTRTGMALGLMENAVWEQRSKLIGTRESLVLYSDGITEAQNNTGELYGEERLVQTALANVNRSPEKMQEMIFSDLRLFVNAAPQSDDITLLLLKRE